ncbi:hypothetical protein BJ170DRAFT_596365 [Xylariales sp. AK1849]|nr:hypothetical protein BJ170DRAFT_596365 [Xylariales sp. AK1849]
MPRSSKKKSPRSAPQAAVPVKGQGVGCPRLDPYSRLINRFFEPLILLEALGVTRGDHTRIPHKSGTPGFTRRRLLDNLAYLCDNDKGGPTTTAIGLEERQDCFKFWVASNRASEKTILFMNSVLSDLRKLFAVEADQREYEEEQFVHSCIRFSRIRILKEGKLLAKSIASCKDHLSKEGGPRALQLRSWLNMFNMQDNARLCYLAYGYRKGEEMTAIATRSRVTDEDTPQNSAAADFGTLRHRLGRLAHHIRASEQVITDSTRLQTFFDEFVVCPIPVLPSVARPEPDNHTTLHGILNRMISSDDDSVLSNYVESLTDMDQKLKILERIKGQYRDEKFKPCVHAEIQVLEHFYKEKLQYAQGDRYIGCSKPACFSCHLYIRIHPAGCVAPQTHQNIYLNWGPPALQGRSNDEGYTQQRDILNEMLKSIRREALGQIDRKAAAFKWHPDSQTGITQTTRSDIMSVGDHGSLDEAFERLNLSSADRSRDSNESDAFEFARFNPGSPGSSNGETVRYASNPDVGISADEDDPDSDGGAYLSD